MPLSECYHHLEHLDTYFNRNTLSISTSTMVQVTDSLLVIFILILGIMINHLNPSGTSINLRSDERLTLYAIFIFCILHNTKCLIADKAGLVEDSPPASFLT